jgi:hypothetical protein
LAANFQTHLKSYYIMKTEMTSMLRRIDHVRRLSSQLCGLSTAANF